MQVMLDTRSIKDYRKFLQIKRLPCYRIQGRMAEFPDEYAGAVGLDAAVDHSVDYEPNHNAYDYQRDIVRMALERRKFAIFADCGLGKTLMLLDFAYHAMRSLTFGQRVLIVSPYNVVDQTLEEAGRFYNDQLRIEKLPAAKLADWLTGPLKDQAAIGITNYEAITDGLDGMKLGGLILDESSILKSHYGKIGRRLIELGRGCKFKLCCTGTPAPNDRIEYGNHAVFLDQHPTVNAFLARYFVNRGCRTGRSFSPTLRPTAGRTLTLRPFRRSTSTSTTSRSPTNSGRLCGVSRANCSRPTQAASRDDPSGPASARAFTRAMQSTQTSLRLSSNLSSRGRMKARLFGANITRSSAFWETCFQMQPASPARRRPGSGWS